MTIVSATKLSNRDMDQLGNNVRPAVKQDQQDQHDHAVNRSLAVYGEEIDLDIERACASEEVAS